MSDSRWTPLQEQAITVQGCNVLVSAAAGAGKTSVLVERLIRRLLDPVSPLEIDRLLAVTFTEKAAAEMKQRIRASLERAKGASPGDTRVERQLLVLDRAQISTIHSFCLSIVRRYFYKAGLDPRFRVLDDNEAEMLRQDALSELFEERYDDAGEQGEAFRDLVDRYGGKGTDEGLQGALSSLHDFARTQTSMEGWLGEAEARADLPPGEDPWSSPWMKCILARACRELTRAISYAESALAICRTPEGPGGYDDAVASDLTFYREVLDILAGPQSGPAEYREAVSRLLSFDHLRLGRVAKTCDPDSQKLAKELRDEGKDLLGKVKSYAFMRPVEDLAREMRETAPFVRTLVSLVRDLDTRFTRKKTDRAGVDFSDLERYCLAILEQDGCQVAAEVRKGYDCVLVDEYQDTNPLQERILSLVSDQEGPGNRFMVGDLKQSIYRFRLAEPRIFLEKFRTYRKTGEGESLAPSARGAAGVRIDLTHNFRSRKEVVDAVNFLFSDFMRADAGEIEYRGDHELRQGASYPDGGEGEFWSELHLVERERVNPGDNGREDDGTHTLEEFEALEKEALVAAARIAAIVDPANPLVLWDSRSGTNRPCSFKDIAVLMRSTKERANAVLEVFGRCDIPAYADTGSGYFQAREVEVALSLLSVIDNPRQDIPLAAVLRSPVAGLTPADLARIRADHKRGDFFEAVKAYAEWKPEKTPEKTLAQTPADGERLRIVAVLNRFFTDLDRWRTLARRRPLAEVLWTVLGETGYQDYVGGLPGGAQRQANLRALCDRAREFDSYGRHGLFSFLRFVEKLRDKKGDLGTARALGEHEDVVRVMSIHKAKGLEFPVVIVIDLGKQFNLDDIRQDILYHRDLGIAPLFCDLPNRVKYPTGPHQAVAMRVRDENLAEEMRVLYVALTRAKEKLIMIGSARGLDSRFHKWTRTDPAAAVTCLDWICPALQKQSGPPVTLKVWGTEDGDAIPVPGSRTARDHELTWRDVRDLKPPAASNEETYSEVTRRLEWTYPHAAKTTTFAKMSVGELRRRLEEEEEDAWRMEDRPLRSPEQDGAGDRPLRGAARGVAVHALLARMDLREAATLEGVRREAERLLDLGLIESPGLDEQDIRRVAGFFATEEGRALLESPGIVRREVPFTMGVPSALFTDAGSAGSVESDSVIVQGVIDVLTVEEDGLVILDYKTDDIPESALPARYSSYVPQIALYALAAERILKKPIKRASIVFLSRNRVFEAPWRDYLSARGLD